jgi:hypothetical protein
MQLGRFLLGAAAAERRLGEELQELADRHANEADVHFTARTLARGCAEQLAALQPAAARYGAPVADPEPSAETMHHAAPSAAGDGEGLALLADLRRSYLAAQQAEILWATVLQGAKAARDPALIDAVERAQEHAERCAKWLRTRIKASAAQALVAG